jgi:hypothetical protein
MEGGCGRPRMNREVRCFDLICQRNKLTFLPRQPDKRRPSYHSYHFSDRLDTDELPAAVQARQVSTNSSRTLSRHASAWRSTESRGVPSKSKIAAFGNLLSAMVGAS